MSIERWPPMIGVVGFDSGYRPAVALAIPPLELAPVPGEPIIVVVGACCSGTWPTLTCSLLSQADCTNAGGHYLGDGTTCAGVDCNSGACCEFGGSCSDEQEFLCGDCSPSMSCWSGYGTTCATTRCEGACAICDTCNAICTCYDATTYAECQAMIPAHGGSGWLLNGNCVTNDCGYFGCTYNLEFGACCTGGFCLDNQTQIACTDLGGTFWQGGISCINASICGHSECG